MYQRNLRHPHTDADENSNPDGDKPLTRDTILPAAGSQVGQEWKTAGPNSVRFEVVVADGTCADYVVSGQGPDDRLDGMAKIRRFKKEPFVQILVAVNMLHTGFDRPEVRNLVFARFIRSGIRHQQMRGRGTRKTSRKPEALPRHLS